MGFVRRSIGFVLLLGLATSAFADTDEALRLARVRLDLAREVALAKLYSRGAIEDLKREAEVVEKVRGQARELGVDPEFAAKFFRAQIEASKEAQRAWQAKWAREGAPFGPRPDLAKSIRPKLDALTPRILEALKDARPGEPLFAHSPPEIWLFGVWSTVIKPLQGPLPKIERRIGNRLLRIDQTEESDQDPTLSLFAVDTKGRLSLLDRKAWDALPTAYRVDAVQLKSRGLLVLTSHDGNQTQIGYLWTTDAAQRKLVRLTSDISNPGAERLARGEVREATVGRWANQAPRWAAGDEWIFRIWRFDPGRQRAVPGAWRRS